MFWRERIVRFVVVPSCLFVGATVGATAGGVWFYGVICGIGCAIDKIAKLIDK